MFMGSGTVNLEGFNEVKLLGFNENSAFAKLSGGAGGLELLDMCV